MGEDAQRGRTGVGQSLCLCLLFAIRPALAVHTFCPKSPRAPSLLEPAYQPNPRVMGLALLNSLLRCFTLFFPRQPSHDGRAPLRPLQCDSVTFLCHPRRSHSANILSIQLSLTIRSLTPFCEPAAESRICRGSTTLCSSPIMVTHAAHAPRGSRVDQP